MNGKPLTRTGGQPSFWHGSALEMISNSSNYSVYRLYNDSPVRQTVVSNDRWGHDTLCKHGDFYTCSDRYNPGNKYFYFKYVLLSYIELRWQVFYNYTNGKTQ